MDLKRVFAMKFAGVYPMYVQKAERKNRTKEEVDTILCWLTGYTRDGLAQQLDGGSSLETFFAEAPQMHPNCDRITGVVCGIRVENIEDPLCRRSATWTSSSTNWPRGRRWRRYSDSSHLLLQSHPSRRDRSSAVGTRQVSRYPLPELPTSAVWEIACRREEG